MKKFTHNYLSLPELETQEINGKRYYITPEGNYRPSITTLLGQTSKEGMASWRASIGEEEADKISSYACEVGTLFHEHVEKYLQNKENYLDNCTPHSKYMFIGVQDKLDNIDNILVQESALYSDVLRIAGRTDCIAEYEGELSIIDFKTSRKEKKEEWIENYFVQGTAYSLMLEEMTRIKVNNITIIMSVYDSTPIVFKTKRNKHYKSLADIIKKHLPDLEYKNEI
jgi:ATP-dependent exoDNAse (exonuclease V) beta subunit